MAIVGQNKGEIARNHMAFIETNPERVKSCFQDPRVKYAA